MSLEQAIQENTAAIRELIASLNAGRGLLDIKNSVPTPIVGIKDADVAPKAEPAVVEQQTPAAEPAVVEQPSPEPQTLDLKKDVAPVFLKLCASKGRDAGASVLAKYKAEKLSDIPADKLVDVLADIQRAAA